MIIITGANGFIGSTLVERLIKEGFNDLLLVDDYSKNKFNFSDVSILDRNLFFDWFLKVKPKVEFIFHLGARTDTLCGDLSLIKNLNISFSKRIWNIATEYNIPMLYASSAATYGLGELGYSDSHDLINKLKPLNLYAKSKQDVDLWVLKQKQTPPFWAGLKFFNVYGKNEQFKNNMSSMIYKLYHKMKNNEEVFLFKHGKQQRDFIYVEDVVDVCLFFMKNQRDSGIYNVGTGVARSFNDIIHILFRKEMTTKKLKYIDVPIEIEKQYQPYTKADISKLRSVGYNNEFHTLESGINKYYYE